MTGHIYQEVLNGIGDKHVGTSLKIRNRLRSKVYAPTRSDYEKAVDLSRKYKGLALSIADLMNCAVSSQKGWRILAIDKDYDLVYGKDKAVKPLEIE